MKRIFTVFFIVFFLSQTLSAQFHLIVNEFSQGNGGTKEFVELLVVGTRTCTDSTADIRNWVVDDQNGWYGAAGTGIAGGHYRFANNANWQKVPYGSIVLLYNDGDRNGSIPSGIDDPTDANHDYVYVVPISNNLMEQNSAIPSSPSSPTFVYPTTGYSASSSWSSLGLSNSGDAVIVADPANLGIAHFSIIFGFTAGAGFQTPTVTKGNVAANKNCYLNDDLYTTASSWIVGNAGTSDETPGKGNSAANTAWIMSMRMQTSATAPQSSITQPTCANPNGTITITNPVGATYTYSIDGINFQVSPIFPGLAPNTYTVTVMATGGCTSNANFVVNAAPGSPATPSATTTQPTCTAATGTITVTNPVGTTYSYSIDGINFQASPIFPGLAPNSYTVTVMATGGCTSNAVFVVNPAPGLPAAPTTTIGQPTCTAATGTITVTNPVGATYSYSIDGINFQSSPVFNGLAPNSYTVTVMAAGGCTSSGSALVNAVPGFTLNLNASPNPVGQGSILSLTTSSVSAYQVIAWLPTSVFPDQVAMTQSIVATTNTTYVAVGKSPDGCIDSAQVTITVTSGKNDVFVPNVFTPNNDGKNDKLFVYGNLIREIDFKIFNQWGELVFQTIDKNIGWDGRYKGSMQPVTVYIYVLKATMQDGSIITKKGSVTLVR